MNPSFNIKSAAAVTDAHLFVFAGKQGISFAELDRQRNMFNGISVYHFQNDCTDTERDVLLQQILENEPAANQFFSKTDIVWCAEQSIITPQAYFNRDNAAGMLELVFGDAGEYAVKNELLLKQQAYNVYRLEKATEKLLMARFNGAIQSHQSSLMVNFESDRKDLLYCNFYPGSFTVMLRKHRQLQVIQTFYYSTPEDAAYYLLNICRRFGVDAAETAIAASGMIDESSGLYRELYKYFLQLDFYESPGMFAYSDEIKTYPAHYFSHLFATAACVL